MELIQMKKLVILLVESFIGVMLILGFFYLLGIVENFLEKHLVIFGIITIITIIKFIQEILK
jgi:hypothetical protein